ncbi:MAG: 6,7-dimethyl-8-ribityllumazine synthase [Alphaproteobacteria bacterium]|nr:6,7-dimethyl-8-ribityllumazine synthase [Alphaproteobacteria bacterium]
MADKQHIMIVEARFYEDISEHLLNGAVDALSEAGMSYERFIVPGALEIPAVVKLGYESGKFDAYIALGCVIRGETSHYNIVAVESARGLMDLALEHSLAIGNCILTCDTREQAIARADPENKNKGSAAVSAVLALLNIKEQLGFFHE